MGIIGLIIFVGVDALEFHPMANLCCHGCNDVWPLNGLYL